MSTMTRKEAIAVLKEMKSEYNGDARDEALGFAIDALYRPEDGAEETCPFCKKETVEGPERILNLMNNWCHRTCFEEAQEYIAKHGPDAYHLKYFAP